MASPNYEYKLEVMKPRRVNLKPSNSLEAAMMKSLRAWTQLHDSLTDERERQGTTQRQVADSLEISQPAVSAFENNNSADTQIGTVISYAAALGLKINFSIEKAN